MDLTGRQRRVLTQWNLGDAAGILAIRLVKLISRIDINELVQERRNSIANALESRLSCTNPLIS